ncbi:hypothetical protein E2C01_073226 [Portunus trituberculatus]|uniref:Uncharacterized protein n=1 Tax=Portunus trituberculatus TaxID=210409 RepID=A0A5B7IA12_PORTR|nr:hypothetical protein [Portunus trituberculatus]
MTARQTTTKCIRFSSGFHSSRSIINISISHPLLYRGGGSNPSLSLACSTVIVRLAVVHGLNASVDDNDSS